MTPSSTFKATYLHRLSDYLLKGNLRKNRERVVVNWLLQPNFSVRYQRDEQNDGISNLEGRRDPYLGVNTQVGIRRHFLKENYTKKIYKFKKPKDELAIDLRK